MPLNFSSAHAAYQEHECLNHRRSSYSTYILKDYSEQIIIVRNLLYCIYFVFFYHGMASLPWCLLKKEGMIGSTPSPSPHAPAASWQNPYHTKKRKTNGIKTKVHVTFTRNNLIFLWSKNQYFFEKSLAVQKSLRVRVNDMFTLVAQDTWNT